MSGIFLTNYVHSSDTGTAIVQCQSSYSGSYSSVDNGVFTGGGSGSFGSSACKGAGTPAAQAEIDGIISSDFSDYDLIPFEDIPAHWTLDGVTSFAEIEENFTAADVTAEFVLTVNSAILESSAEIAPQTFFGVLYR